MVFGVRFIHEFVVSVIDSVVPSVAPIHQAIVATPTVAVDSATTTGGGATGVWLSSASRIGAGDDGGFGSWRGTSLESGTTWSDTGWTTMTSLWQFDPGQQFYNFAGTVGLAPGAIYDSMTWAQTASGSADVY